MQWLIVCSSMWLAGCCLDLGHLFSPYLHLCKNLGKGVPSWNTMIFNSSPFASWRGVGEFLPVLAASGSSFFFIPCENVWSVGPRISSFSQVPLHCILGFAVSTGCSTSVTFQVDCRSAFASYLKFEEGNLSSELLSIADPCGIVSVSGTWLNYVSFILFGVYSS